MDTKTFFREALNQEIANLKLMRERDPVSKGDKEVRKEARYTYEDIQYLLQLQVELINKSTTSSKFIFHCAECNIGIIEDSKEHDNCMCNEDGEEWKCGNCAFPEMY